MRLVERWDGFRADLLAFLQEWDVVLAPVHTHAAFPHGGEGEHMPGFSYTMTWSLAGLPAAVVRTGATPEGLPIGVQAVARPWREADALAAVGCIERALGGYVPPGA